MNSKEYLQQLTRSERAIRRKRERLEALRALAVAMPSVDVSKDRVQGGGHNDRLAETVAKMVDLDHEIQEDVREFRALRVKLLREIARLENKQERRILFLRYIRFKKCREIWQELGIGERYLRTLHGQALKNFSKIL